MLPSTVLGLCEGSEDVAVDGGNEDVVELRLILA